METSRSLLAGALVAITLATRTAAAQNTVNLGGVVRGDSIAIANAQVTAFSKETREIARTTTRPNGEFRIIGLSPGWYSVSVRAVGYRPSNEKVEIVAGRRATLDFALHKITVEQQGRRGNAPSKAKCDSCQSPRTDVNQNFLK